jgi:hypothetical protein
MALASVYTPIQDKIKEFRTNSQTVWFTGHSLGGALAMLAGTKMYFEDPDVPVAGIYTFGQPAIGDRTLASAYSEDFKSRAIRFVNNNDMVPRTSLCQHTGTVKYIDSTGKLHDKMTIKETAMDRLKGFTSDPFAPGSDGLRDHFYWAYLANLEKNFAASPQ